MTPPFVRFAPPPPAADRRWDYPQVSGGGSRSPLHPLRWVLTYGYGFASWGDKYLNTGQQMDVKGRFYAYFQGKPPYTNRVYNIYIRQYSKTEPDRIYNHTVKSVHYEPHEIDFQLDGSGVYHYYFQMSSFSFSTALFHAYFQLAGNPTP